MFRVKRQHCWSARKVTSALLLSTPGHHLFACCCSGSRLKPPMNNMPVWMYYSHTELCMNSQLFLGFERSGIRRNNVSMNQWITGISAGIVAKLIPYLLIPSLAPHVMAVLHASIIASDSARAELSVNLMTGPLEKQVRRIAANCPDYGYPTPYEILQLLKHPLVRLPSAGNIISIIYSSSIFFLFFLFILNTWE